MTKNKTDGIVTLLDQYKSEKDLRIFAEAQMQTIMELQRKLKDVEEKFKLPEVSTFLTVPEDGDLSDQRAIATMQIMRLRDISIARELTLEETKKLEIYDRILSKRQSEKDVTPTTYKKMTDEELALVASEDHKSE